MKNEKEAIKILQDHDCDLVMMLSECTVLWKNKAGIIRCNDLWVLRNMSESAWNFCKNN